MAQEQGLYGECKKFEVALGIKTFNERLVTQREDFYKKIKVKIDGLKIVDQNYGICISAKNEINSGKDWSTNKFIRDSIDDLIKVGDNYKASVAKYSADYNNVWIELDNRIKQSINTYSKLVEDTISSQIEAQSIFNDLQQLKKNIEIHIEDVEQVSANILNQIDKNAKEFVDIIDPIWKNMKKKEKDIFAVKDNTDWISDWFKEISVINLNSDSLFITQNVDSALSILNKRK